MNSDQLTPEQAKQLADYIHRVVAWSNRMRKRMDARRWPHDDNVRLKVDRLHDAAHDLWVDLFYKSCGMSDGQSTYGTVASDSSPPQQSGDD